MTKTAEIQVKVKAKKNRSKRRKSGYAQHVKTVRASSIKRIRRQPPGRRNRYDDLEQYRLALRDPFHVDAVGVRVPDSYCFPTVTYHIRTQYVISAGAGGEVTFLFLPSPAFSYLKYAGGISTPASIFAQNNDAGYLVSPTELATKLTEYRVVSWGIKLIAKDTAFASKGKLYLALVPTTNNAPSWNTMETVSASSVSVVAEYTAGLTFGYVGNAIMNYPSVKVYSMQDLLRGDVTVTGLPLSASFYDFKGTSDRSNTEWNAGQVIADEGVFNSSTGLVNSTAGGRKDVASLRGGMAVLLYATGLPANTNEFDIEVIYHLEGSPNTSGPGGYPAAKMTLIPSAQQVLHGSTSLVESAISTVRRTVPLIRMAAEAVNRFGATRGVVQAALGAAAAVPRIML